MMLDLVVIVLAWFAGGFINGVAGFGAAMIAMPLIAPYIDFAIAVPSCVLIVLTLNIQVSWTFRHHIEWQHVREICIGAIPGVILSFYILEYVSEQWLKMGMGLFISCYALWSLYADSGRLKTISRLWGYLAGLLSTALGMAFGFNGPPLAAYIAYSGCAARAVKGVLGAGFIVTGLLITTAKAVNGEMTTIVMQTFAAATPAVILGSKLGIKLSASLNEYAYRKILFIALALMGGKIVWTSWG